MHGTTADHHALTFLGKQSPDSYGEHWLPAVKMMAIVPAVSQ